MTSPSQEDLVEIGRVGRAHGLDGSFYVTRPEEGVLEVGLELRVAGRGTVLERLAGTRDRPIVRVAACGDRASAEALRGESLTLLRSQLPPLAEDEFWADELVGAAVVDGERLVGSVLRMISLPSCEVLEVARHSGGDPLLVPLVSDAIRAIDPQAGRVDVDLAFLGERTG